MTTPFSPFLQSAPTNDLAERIDRRRKSVVAPLAAAPQARDISNIPTMTGLAQQFSSPFSQIKDTGVQATYFAEQQAEAERLKKLAEEARKNAQTLSPFAQIPQGSGSYTFNGKLSEARNKILQAAMSQQGVPYSWGGGNASGPTLGQPTGAYPKQATTTVGFDCSGLVQYAYAKAGIKMPRVSYGQLKMGGKTAIANLQPGDLVGFGNGSHIAIYMGNGQIIEAPSTFKNVRVRKLSPSELKNAWGVHIVM